MTQTPKFSAWVKATDRLSGPPKPSLAWAFAKRPMMHIYADRIEVGDWTLNNDAITAITLYQTPDIVRARMLEIVTPERTVQINFNPGTDPTPHLPHPPEIKPYPSWLRWLRIVIWAFVGIAVAAQFFA